ncbi:hypothetical protein JG688_00013220, partial [Phytophthora aleatoria]
VLSQVSIAPAKPVEVEPVVETAASERGESVAVDAVEGDAKVNVGYFTVEVEAERGDVCLLCGDCG